MDPSEEEEYYSIVPLFPTGEDRFYISKIPYNPEHANFCNWTGPKNSIIDELEYISHCPNVAKYIQGIYTNCPIEDETNCCKYLNYSINDVVKKDGNHIYNEENVIQAYGRLAIRMKKCENRIKSIEKRVFMNIKELSNIYYKFNKYINAIKANQIADCEDVYDSVKLYLSNENSCKGLTNKFCDAVDNFNNYYRSHISLINCEKVEYKSKPILKLDNTKNVKLEEEAGAKGRQNITDEIEGVIEGGMGPEITAPLSNKELNVGDDNADSLKDNTSNPVRTITYTSLGLVLPLATLYRLTPLGSWVNTKILGKNKLMDNMKKNHYELLLNDVRNGEMSLNDTTYSISYNSAAK